MKLFEEPENWQKEWEGMPEFTCHVYTDNDNRLKFAQALEELHPDIVKVTWKFNRWHHQVDYRVFKRNKLIKKPNIVIEKDKYKMILKTINSNR